MFTSEDVGGRIFFKIVEYVYLMHYKLYNILEMIIKNKIHMNEGQILNEIKKE